MMRPYPGHGEGLQRRGMYFPARLPSLSFALAVNPLKPLPFTAMPFTKNKILRISLLLAAFLALFASLILGSVFFQVLLMGWGASAYAPEFNMDIAMGAYLLVIAFAAYRKNDRDRKEEVATVGVLVFALFLVLHLWL